MSDLSDNEINQILETLAKQGIEYTMSKEDMKKILKNGAKKSRNDLEKNSENDSDIEVSKVEEDAEISKMDINEECNNIIDSIIKNNIENDDIENNIEKNIENNIKNITQTDLENKNTDFILKNDIELDELIESSNAKLNELLSKKDVIKKKHNDISENLKNIRKKLDDNYNIILDKQDELKTDYISKLNNIKENLVECISTPIQKKNIIIPPLNLDGINSTKEYPNFEKYNKLHNKILDSIPTRNKFPTHTSSPPPQNKYSPFLSSRYPPSYPQKHLYPQVYQPSFQSASQSGYFTERPPLQSPYLTHRHPTQQSPYLTERQPPPHSPYLTDRRPPHTPYFTNRYPSQQNTYTDRNKSIQEEQKTLFDGTIWGEKYKNIASFYKNDTIKTTPIYNKPRDNMSSFDKYLKERYPDRNNDRYTDRTNDRYTDFDALCKKYETDRDNEQEIIITASGPPSNAMDIINNALDKFEKEFYYDESKNEKASLRSIFDKLKNYKKTPLPKYDKDELAYYETLEEKKKDKIDKLEIKISQINNIKTPLRFRVLQSNLPLYNKSMIINKIEDLFSNKLLGGSEITKYSNWVNSLLKVPFKKFKKLPIDVDTNSEEDIGKYLIDVKKTLDTAVYGHTKTKEQVIQIIAQWITNPNCIGNCIGIQGVMGNGKTTLVKNGIAKAIGRPFAFITLGGCSDSSFLEGHNYTYEGSMWGKIVDVLMECKCMNPVFYFDELDKVSETPKGEEIINSLIHLTDASQNNQYADKYFNGVEFDLSKSLFIFSYNDITKINPILLDRLICIKTDKFELDDKIHIAKNYLLREIYEQLKIKEDTYKIEDDNIKYIIETYTGDEGGVRTLKKHLYNIFSKFNLLNLTKNDDTIKYSFDLEEDLLEKKIITNEIIDVFIKDKTKIDGEIDDSIKHWYM